MNNYKKICTKSGVTLLVLVITVIILIILAGVTINVTIGEHGIFKHGQEAKVKQQIAEYLDNIELARGEATLDKMGRPTLDELIEKIKQNNVIPGGRIIKLDEEKAEAITKEGYVIIITQDGIKYDRTEKVEDIPELKEGDIVISVQPEDEWVNTGVTVTIQNNVAGNFTLKYSLDEEKWITYKEPFKVSKNTNVYACLENVVGEQGNHTSIEINKIDKLDPIEFIPVVTNTTNTITISAVGAQDAEARDGYAQSGIGEIWYKCYKKGEAGQWKTNEDKTKTDYTFIELEDNEKYIVEVKVIDKAKNEITTVPQEINTDEMQTAEGNVTIKSLTWNASTHKASVSIEKGSSVASTLQIQYQVNGDDEDGWTTGTSVGNLNHGDVVNARLWDGNNGGSYTSLTVKDSGKPAVNVSITGKGTNTMSASVTASDSQWGMETNPTYTFYIKKTAEADTTYVKTQSTASTTCNFSGLEQETSYTVKVEVKDKAKNTGSGTASDTTGKVTVAQGNITIKAPSWNASTHKASVSIEKGSSVASSLQIQYQVNDDAEDGWITGTSVGSLNHGDVVNARLWDGNNGGSYTSLTVKDSGKPAVNVSITGKGTNTISASVTASDSQWGMETNPTYTFYIKKTAEADTTYVKTQSTASTTCNFSGLDQETSYTVKVEVKDKAKNTGSGTASDTTGKVTVAQGNITIKSPSWNASTHKASVSIEKGSSVASTLQIQYQVNGDDEDGWTTGTSVGNLNHGDVVNARLWDGNNGGSYTSLTVKDSTKPNSPSVAVQTGTSGTNGYYKSNVVVKITAGTDGQSGVQKVTYSLSGATTKAETTITSGNTITISNEGTTKITAYTYDKANNKSTAKTLDVKKDVTAPGSANISLSGNTTQTSLPVTLKATVKHSDGTSGITISSCKYVLNTTSGNIGTNSSSYTGGTFSSNEQEITITPSSATKWYLHVLTIDGAGNAKETIKGPISVKEKYHIHKGTSSSKEGCYITPVYHSHTDSCYIICNGYLVFDKQATASNGTPQGNYHCSVCGKGYFYGMPYHTGSAAGQACGKKTFNCSKNDTYIDYYGLGCEKTEETLEGYNVSY